MNLGSCFLYPSGPQNKLHLSVVCSNQVATPDMRLLVNITTLRGLKSDDYTCIVETNEHPFVTHRSYVAYRHATLRSVNKINGCIKSGLFVQKPDLDPAVLQRVLDGFKHSDFAAPWTLEYLPK